MIWRSRFFTLAEFTASDTAVRLGLKNTPDAATLIHIEETAYRMDAVRELVDAPCILTSGFRSLKVNRAIGSSDESDHVKGWAGDVKSPQFGTAKALCLAVAASDIEFDQVIYEGTWMHISFNPRMRRQLLTAVFKAGRATRYAPGIV